MAFWPDIVSNLLPGFALLITCTSLIFLIAMKKASGGFIIAFYTLRAMDLLLGLSLFYAGFHGILLSVYSEQNEQIPPIKCLFTAAHLHFWLFTDSAQILLLTLLCVDQFISVVWTKRHKEFSEYYFNTAFIIILLLFSFISFIPAWINPILLSENSTIKISSFCSMQDVFGQFYYNIQLEIRKWFPIGCIICLFIILIILFSLQLIQKGHFKWSDNNKQSTKLFILILCRIILFTIYIHIPILELPLIMKIILPNYYNNKLNTKSNISIIPNEQKFLQEILIRIWQSLLIGLLEPILDIIFIPQFPAEIFSFFNLNKMKRTWQSVDDPPRQNQIVGSSGFDIFGSFHSITGNIIGEAGIPMELNADIQRSLKFFIRIYQSFYDF
ncbi:hypothetical protein Mgra_00002631 [Meloidogyne graminicola]|uniref:G_PROTEIN_RECEP_F1_2 domain-containing protein n=1 Tax=Meloidogyne graminicola TaxID=189291 RepID=A0A8S9ZXS6_9BILA|nr:hypothetical protein Mgra_00002631 [Meloidogyne graminicola]